LTSKPSKYCPILWEFQCGYLTWQSIKWIPK
jgi:hypothetical protein